jgi:hypothetical protein
MFAYILQKISDYFQLTDGRSNSTSASDLDARLRSLELR